MLALLPHSEELIRVANHEREVLQQEYGMSAKEVIAQARRGFVHGALEETLTHAKNDTGHSLADKIDKVLTNRWLGLPVLMLVLYVVFECTFTLGAYPQEWIANGVEALAEWLRGLICLTLQLFLWVYFACMAVPMAIRFVLKLLLEVQQELVARQ
mgnify:CR=1 FL=1